ncbi:MAG TPA: 1-deoxy-D-xylulose-5-phosphate reductoisomerase, partial [Candidatus Omnitrophica bacterium]|nr:1-deoxy-D-xylulose-5-phosphate reductoisomerase [Candidatus Omnitrophota bacterium]
MRKIVVFGSTGSIGKNVLACLEEQRSNLSIYGLCANKDIKTLYSQIKKFHPRCVCVRDEKKAKELKKNLPKKIKLFKGEKGLEEFVSLKSDISFMAISGISCLRPLIMNLSNTKRIALANKESMVVAGNFILKKAKKCNTEIIPLDSEINALFQLLKKEN